MFIADNAQPPLHLLSRVGRDLLGGKAGSHAGRVAADVVCCILAIAYALFMVCMSPFLAFVTDPPGFTIVHGIWLGVVAVFTVLGAPAAAACTIYIAIKVRQRSVLAQIGLNLLPPVAHFALWLFFFIVIGYGCIWRFGNNTSAAAPGFEPNTDLLTNPAADDLPDSYQVWPAAGRHADVV